MLLADLAVQMKPRKSESRHMAASLAAALADAGCGRLFGVPGGGHNLDLVGAAEAAGLVFVLAHGETAAVLMAAAYAEMTGQVGACVVTRGPGAASAANGVAHALLDRVPLLIITDAIAPTAAARNTHQLLDQQALFTPITKWTVALTAGNAEETAARALAVATAAPPGPVHLDFTPEGSRTAPQPPAATSRLLGDCRRLEGLIARTERPVVAVGVGARRKAAVVSALLARLSCPVLTTYKAKGLMPESSSAAAGLLTGATIESAVLDDADLIVAIGLDPVELIPGAWPYRAPVVSVAEWPTTSRYFTCAAELVAPLEETIDLLLPLTSVTPSRTPRLHLEAAIGRLDAIATASGDRLSPQAVVKVARATFPYGTTATVDSGAHMLVAMPYWQVDEANEALISSGLATVGYALPAAIGAALAKCGPVVCFTGDGGLSMALGELETLARLALPVTVVVFNDAALSLIEIKQGEGQGGPRAVKFAPSDYCKVAQGLGCDATVVATRRELGEALETARDAARPYLIDARIDAGGYGAILDAIRGGVR
jgi:acetolactate synthase I/II/III large subunit